MEPNFSHRYRRPRGVERTTTPKLWSALGPRQANHKKVDTFRQGEVRPSSSHREKTRTRVKTPTTRDGYARLGEGRPNNHQPRLCPTSNNLQGTNRYPMLKFTETLIWMQGEQCIEPTREWIKVKSNGEVTSLYGKWWGSRRFLNLLFTHWPLKPPFPLNW